MLPLDHTVAPTLEDTDKSIITDGNEIPADMIGVDIGPKTIVEYENILKRSKTVFWNGPMGVFEKPPFDMGTNAIAKAMAAVTGTTVIGGGDSVSAINKAGVADSITHISTGGGASLEFVQGKVLPGVDILMQ